MCAPLTSSPADNARDAKPPGGVRCLVASNGERVAVIGHLHGVQPSSWDVSVAKTRIAYDADEQNNDFDAVTCATQVVTLVWRVQALDIVAGTDELIDEDGGAPAQCRLSVLAAAQIAAEVGAHVGQFQNRHRNCRDAVDQLEAAYREAAGCPRPAGHS